MKTPDRLLCELRVMFASGQDATALAAIKQDRSAARREPLEVLGDVVRTLDRDSLPYNAELAQQVDALLAGATERTQPTPLEIAERVREACAMAVDLMQSGQKTPALAAGLDGVLQGAAIIIRRVDLAPLLAEPT